MNAQRAHAERRWDAENAEKKLQSEDFARSARCAFVVTKAQRATYEGSATSRAATKTGTASC